MILHNGQTSYAIDPRELSELLAINMPEKEFDTGLIPNDVLRIYEKGKKRVVIAYRPAQMTGLWIEGQADPLHVPLPNLLMARITSDNFKQVKYSIVTTKVYPNSSTEVYHPPLPNIGSDGVCWGTVPKPSTAMLRSANLQEDWSNFLGSHFGNHGTNGKSQSEKHDIRKLLQKLNDEKTQVYPVDDLVPRKQRLSEWMDKLCQ